MAVFKTQIFKQISGSDREWSNTYLIEAADLETANACAVAIANQEVALHLDNVTITRARTSDTVEGTDVFTTTPLGLAGDAGSAADLEWMPLFNTIRVDIAVSGGGRPSRKYYRTPVPETFATNDLLNGTVRTLFEGTIGSMITAVDGAGGTLVDPDGQAWLGGVTYPKIQMRQLHRKRKKKVVSTP